MTPTPAGSRCGRAPSGARRSPPTRRIRPIPRTRPIPPHAEAPAEGDLTPGTQNGITGPSSAKPGETITVGVGSDRVGDKVDGWIFSTPTHLGTRTVSAAGSIQLTIPSTLAAGAHRLAVLDADGNVIGWLAITVSPAAIAATGADADGGLALAALLLAAGVLLVGGRRLLRRRAPPAG